MNKGTRIVVVDDHSLFRQGIIRLLSEMPEFQVVGDAPNGEAALEIIAHSRPDLVLLDVNMPVMDGVETVKALRMGVCETCKILMLTISEEHHDLIGAIQAGADGYLLKNAEPADLRKAILLVMEGKSVIAPEVTRQVFNVVGNPDLESSKASALTDRELNVLQHLAQGETTMQISKKLFISSNTVKTHVRKILSKLNASNRAEAVSKAIHLNLIHPME